MLSYPTINLSNLLAISLLIILGILPLFSYSSNNVVDSITTNTSSNSTILDLSEWIIANQPIRKIEGNWNFYWKQLLTPAHFATVK